MLLVNVPGVHVDFTVQTIHLVVYVDGGPRGDTTSKALSTSNSMESTFLWLVQVEFAAATKVQTFSLCDIRLPRVMLTINGVCGYRFERIPPKQ